MDEDNANVDAVAAKIRRYLHDHSHAADTLEGIARWWLFGSTDPEWLSKVGHAVEHLVRRGEMARQTLGDGTVIFERNRSGLE